MSKYRFYTGSGTQGYWEFSEPEIEEMRLWILQRFPQTKPETLTDSDVVLSVIENNYRLVQWIIDNNLGENPLN